MNANAPGFFGKVTSHGDFVARRLPPAVVEAWDGWLQQCIHTSKQQLGADWLKYYLTSPIWRFAAAAGVLGQQAWAGVMMPSVDRVGRHFPLMVAAPGSDAMLLPGWVSKGRDWYDNLEDLARGSLESGFVLDQFDRALAAMPAPPGQSSIPKQIAPAGWRLALGERDQLPDGITQLLLQGHSLWWSEGSPSVAPSMLVCKGMPAPDAFAAMLDGRWQARGWG